MKFDVIVIGARCAGAATAMLLARGGLKVLLVDKNRFPSDTLSSHFIHPTGIALLRDWQLLEEVVRSNCPRIERWSFDLGPATISGRPPPIDGVAESHCPRRIVLDDILVRAAVRAGVEFRQTFTVRDLVRDGERVCGIRGESLGGTSVTELASLVVGADGRRSLVAERVEAPRYEERGTFCFSYYTYWSGAAVSTAEFTLRPGRAVFAFPTNDGLVCTYVSGPRPEFERFRGDLERNFLDALELTPSLAERLRAGRRVRHIVGTAELPNFFRKRCGNGWALAGDAAHHKDPIGGYGISHAFRDAEQLSVAIEAGLSGRRPLAEALTDYETARSHATLPIYEQNCRTARLEAPSRRARWFLEAVARSRVESDRFIGAHMGTVPVEEFYSAANVARIVGHDALGCVAD